MTVRERLRARERGRDTEVSGLSKREAFPFPSRCLESFHRFFTFEAQNRTKKSVLTTTSATTAAPVTATMTTAATMTTSTLTATTTNGRHAILFSRSIKIFPLASILSQTSPSSFNTSPAERLVPFKAKAKVSILQKFKCWRNFTPFTKQPGCSGIWLHLSRFQDSTSG